MLLEHLIDAPDPENDFQEESRARANAIFDAKVETAGLFPPRSGAADILQVLGAPPDDAIRAQMAQEESSNAFLAFIGQDEEAKLAAVGALSLPESVKSSVAMLTQYQWNFVSQAAELRSMAVSKIVAETDNPNANIRLKALQMLGNVTEVALFTERLEVKKVNAEPGEIEALIREKLAKFAALNAPPVQEVEEIAFQEVQNG